MSVSPYEQLFHSLTPEAKQKAIDLKQTITDGSEKFFAYKSTKKAWKDWAVARDGVMEADPDVGDKFDKLQSQAHELIMPYSEKMEKEFHRMKKDSFGLELMAWGKGIVAHELNRQPWLHKGMHHESIERFHGLGKDDKALRFAYEFVEKAADAFHGGCQRIVQEFCEELGDEKAAIYYRAPLKTYVRAWSKQYEYVREHHLKPDEAGFHYQDAAATILDLERGTIVLGNAETAVKFLNSLQSKLKEHDMEICRAKNRFGSTEEQAAKAFHYRDILMNILVRDTENSNNDVICELQISLDGFFSLKAGMHHHYELLRCPSGNRGARRLLETGH